MREIWHRAIDKETERGVMAELNCDKCRYRYWLARYDVHITADDCDKRGEELCKKMNDPAFIKWMDDNKGRKERP